MHLDRERNMRQMLVCNERGLEKLGVKPRGRVVELGLSGIDPVSGRTDDVLNFPEKNVVLVQRKMHLRYKKSFFEAEFGLRKIQIVIRDLTNCTAYYGKHKAAASSASLRTQAGASAEVVMLEGPVPATKAVLARAGLTMDQIDLVEVSFSS